MKKWKKWDTNPNSTEPEDYEKEEKWSKRIDTKLYLISIVICVGIFYICIIVGIVNETDENEMSNYVPKSKQWVMWKLTRASVSKILEVWNREIYEKVQGWDTKRSNHKNYREKRGWLWQMILPIRKEGLDTHEVYNIGRDVRVKNESNRVQVCEQCIFWHWFWEYNRGKYYMVRIHLQHYGWRHLTFSGI